MKTLRVGIVGCGRVTELCFLPASQSAPCIEITGLVDTDEARVATLAEQFGIACRSRHIEDLFDKVDAAVVALPNALHAAVSLEFLNRGIHVLVEKPMALTRAECESMCSAAKRKERVLAVGLMRRYYPAFRLVKALLHKNVLGAIKSFEFSEGCKWRWKSASDYRFKKDRGGGILSDMGVHLIDTALWWLGDFRNITYYDDSKGGVEANFRLEVVLQNGAQGCVEVSTNRDLRNVYRVVGEQGAIICGTSPRGPLSLVREGQEFRLPEIEDPTLPGFAFVDAFAKQFALFHQAVILEEPSLVDGYEGARSVAIIEACRGKRQALVYPWEVA